MTTSEYTDINNPPSDDLLPESHQVWVWLWNVPGRQPRPPGFYDDDEERTDFSGRWEIRGTGAL